MGRRRDDERPLSRMLEPELLHAIFRDVGDLVVLLHSDRSVHSANPAFGEAVAGAEPGVDFLELVAPSSRDRVLPHLVRAAGGDEVVVEVLHPGADGETVTVEYRFFPVDRGMVAGLGRIRAVGQDARKALHRAEAELLAKSRMLDEIQLELTQVPFIDPVTGVWNRMQILERMTGEWSRSERYDTPLSCLLVDVESLAELREERDENVLADEVLKAVARRLKLALRDHDLLGRYGGDTFVVVAVQADGEAARRLCERIRRGVALEPVGVEGRTIDVALRIGGATNRSEGVEILEDLFGVAEDALAEARSQGRRVLMASEITV